MNIQNQITNMRVNRALTSYNDIKSYISMLKNYCNKNSSIDEKDKLYQKHIQDMRSYCRKLPMMLKTNGLLLTMSFVYSRAQNNSEKNNSEEQIINEYKYIFEWIWSWLSELELSTTKYNNIFDMIAEEPINYKIYTEETLDILLWYKKHMELEVEYENN